MAKRGQKPKHYVAADGRVIEGLCRRASGRFHPVGYSTPSFGSDEQLAIHRFRIWKSEQGNEEPFDPYEADSGMGSIVYHEKQKIRHLILSDCRQAAIELDIPELAYFDQLKPPEPSLTLTEVGDLYFNKRKRISPDWKRKTQRFWQEFCDIVRVRTIADLTHDDFDRYYEAVWDEHEKRGKSETYVQHRFSVVTTIFRHALKRGRAIEQIQRLITLCEMLVPPTSKGPRSKPISPQHFGKLLEVSSEKWRAILLLSLNAALYPSEVSAVKKSDIDLAEKTLVMEREKTGVPRVAVLWGRTVDSIQAYQNKRPHASEHLFVNAVGSPYNANHMGRNFRRRREAAGLPKTVKFENLRDGALTVAITEGGETDKDCLLNVKVLAGHRVKGKTDEYIRRNPRMVAKTCAEIERHYFCNSGSSAK